MDSKYNLSPQFLPLGREFISRRLQSLAGFFFLLFLCEHLFTNSQATFFIGDDGLGFVDSVNWIHSLPYLPAVEITFIALPILVHVLWGIQRIRMAKLNAHATNGSSPSLAYGRNIAFSWQRITSVLLIVGLLLHVGYMRFLKQPTEVKLGVSHEYFVKVGVDPGLYSVAPRLNLILFDKNSIHDAEEHLKAQVPSNPPKQIFEMPVFSGQLAQAVKDNERIEFETKFIDAMKGLAPADDQVVAMSDSVGSAFLMVLRDTYKSVWMCVLYSIFVVVAAFHACNGLWTFAITWGITLSEHSRVLMRWLSNVLMALLIFCGLACVWGVYWINLRY